MRTLYDQLVKDVLEVRRIVNKLDGDAASYKTTALCKLADILRVGKELADRKDIGEHS